MAKHNELGTTGENIAAEFLQTKGHIILSKNFRRPYGELDVVSKDKHGVTHFVEVKSVSWETAYKPEENVHPAKVRRLMRTIQSYLSLRPQTGDWQFDVIAVYLDTDSKKAKVRYLENVVLT